MGRSLRFGLIGLGALGLVALRAHDAAACGGCFTPPENPSVVTDHRMILSISQTQTTLYDQIRYSGAPDSFAWVLPIHGTATVGLSADVVFGTLDSLTRTQVQAPPRFCPSAPFCDGQSGAFGAVDAGTAPPSDGVTVTKQEVVGPYETVQLKATDPTALDTWLQQNSFSIPSDIEPVIAEYVNEGFDFLAMKLVPGAGIDAMRPVRVTLPGASPTLPLRMVAAGTGATVGITLWVVGDGRYEPQNFPFFRITDDELVWDYTTNSSNYTLLRQQKEQQLGNKGWEVESSLNLDQAQFEQIVRYGGTYYSSDYDAGSDYAPIDGPNPETPDQVRDDDLTTLFAGIAQPRVTRIRSDLAHAALDQDLTLQASADQSVLSGFHQAHTAVNVPPCPSYPPCPPGTGDSASAGGFTGGCAVSTPDRAGGVGFGIALFGAVGFAGIGVARRRRKR